MACRSRRRHRLARYDFAGSTPVQWVDADRAANLQPGSVFNVETITSSPSVSRRWAAASWGRGRSVAECAASSSAGPPALRWPLAGRVVAQVGRQGRRRRPPQQPPPGRRRPNRRARDGPDHRCGSAGGAYATRFAAARRAASAVAARPGGGGRRASRPIPRPAARPQQLSPPRHSSNSRRSTRPAGADAARARDHQVGGVRVTVCATCGRRAVPLRSSCVDGPALVGDEAAARRRRAAAAGDRPDDQVDPSGQRLSDSLRTPSTTHAAPRTQRSSGSPSARPTRSRTPARASHRRLLRRVDGPRDREPSVPAGGGPPPRRGSRAGVSRSSFAGVRRPSASRARPAGSRAGRGSMP